MAAILLAAGSSRRFGSANKLLAEVAGRPLVAWTAAAFASSRAYDLIVVTGHEAESIEKALSHLPVRFVHNPDHLSGMGSSVAAGIGGVWQDAKGALISPADMPEMTTELIDTLISAFEAGGCDRVIRPRLPDGRPGHPVLWPRRYFARLAALRGPAGGKTLLDRMQGEVAYIQCSDAGSALDIDTAEDLDRYRQGKRDVHGS